MPDPKPPLTPAKSRERDVTLHEEGFEAASLCWLWLAIGTAMSRELQGRPRNPLANPPDEPIARVLVAEVSKPVRQPECAPPADHREPARQPLGQEVHPRLAALPHVRAKVQERQRFHRGQ